MKIKIYELDKYKKGLTILEKRDAPNYIIEAYKEGHGKIVNTYYRNRTINAVKKNLLNIEAQEVESLSEAHIDLLENSKLNFIKEAARKRDKKFLDTMYTMSNLDIMTGKKLPPNSGRLYLQGYIDSGMKKKLRKFR